MFFLSQISLFQKNSVFWVEFYFWMQWGGRWEWGKIKRLQIQLNSSHKLYKFFAIFLSIMKFMNQAYQGYQYFSLETQPRLDFRQLDQYGRKPSCDDLLCELIGEANENVTQDHAFKNIELNRQPTADSAPKDKKGRKKKESAKILKSGQASGHWKIEENKRYHWFLEIHFNHFLNKHLRRMDKIFKTMEKFIATREAEQCRSHHQKMQKKYGNFMNILRELRRQSYGNEGAGSVIEDMQRNDIEVPQQLLFIESGEAKQARSEMQDSQKLTVDEFNQNEVQVDPLHELNQEYEPNISFMMF